jgi:hypothetical protein
MVHVEVPSGMDVECVNVVKDEDGVVGFEVDEVKSAAKLNKALKSIRNQRNALLTACDYTQLVDCPLPEEKKQEWREYRQALRDFPNSITCPNHITWPTDPNYVAPLPEPEVVEPEVEVVEPEVVEPEVVEPDVVEPEVVAPDVVEPEVVVPIEEVVAPVEEVVVPVEEVVVPVEEVVVPVEEVVAPVEEVVTPVEEVVAPVVPIEEVVVPVEEVVVPVEEVQPQV